MVFNVWQPQGTVIAGSAGFSPQQPTVIYEGNSQLGLSGTVFKMWYENVHTPYGIYYAESSDGLTWTQDSGNPIIASVGGGVKVYKHSTTYYLYCGPGNFSGSAISAYTSSDGVTWALQNANAIVPGSGGAWDNQSVYQLAVCDVVGGTWYGYYAGQASPSIGFFEGLVTSTDGIHWTKDAGNPITSMHSGTMLTGALWVGSGNFCFRKVNGKYYGWSQTALSGTPGFNVTYGLPSDLMRWSAPSASGPWVALGSLTYWRNAASDGVNLIGGQVADPTIVEANGSTYLFYSAVSDGTSEATTGNMNLAIASMTLAQLVKTYEGVQNIPIPFPGGSASLNFQILGSDNFVRASLGSNWTPQTASGWGPAQIVSNLAESESAAVSGDSFYNSVTWPNDQWSQDAIQICQGTTSAAGSAIRISTNQAGSLYRMFLYGVLGSPGNLFIQKYVNGVFVSNPAEVTSVTVNVGDIITGAVIGNLLCLYYNGYLLLQFLDSVSPIVSGAAGFMVSPATSASNAGINNWSGGTLQDAPSPPPVGAGSGAWTQAFRDFVNKRGVHG